MFTALTLGGSGVSLWPTIKCIKPTWALNFFKINDLFLGDIFFQAVNHSAKKKTLEFKTAPDDSVTLDLILMTKLSWAKGTWMFSTVRDGG